MIKTAIAKPNAQKMLAEIEDVVTAVRRCFISGTHTFSVNDEPKTLTTENLAEMLMFVTAYYSWAVTLWGNVKSMAESAEQLRKLKEANAFVSVKKGSKISAKEAEAEASGQVESFIEEEMDWRLVFNRANACRLALESFMKTIDSLKYIRSKEWGSV